MNKYNQRIVSVGIGCSIMLGCLVGAGFMQVRKLDALKKQDREANSKIVNMPEPKVELKADPVKYATIELSRDGNTEVYNVVIDNKQVIHLIVDKDTPTIIKRQTLQVEPIRSKCPYPASN